MGSRGPAPTPKETLKARGSWRGKEEATDAVAPLEIPLMPDGFSESESYVWQQLTSMLFNLRVIGMIDTFPLERYCRNFIRWRAAMDFIAEHGETYSTLDKLGNVRFLPYPQVGIAAKLSDSLLKVEVQFGLTPSARSRIKVSAPKENEKNNGKSRFFAS